jgi:hypothetical protein
MTTKYDIRLDGVHAFDLPMTVMRELANFLIEGTSRATRLAAEGRSVARGTAPSWLAPTAEVRLTGVKEGSLTMEVQARPLAEMAPDVFAQQLLFGGPDGGATAPAEGGISRQGGGYPSAKTTAS